MNPSSFFSDLARFGNEPALIDRASGRVIRFSELEQSLPVTPAGVVATWAKTSLDHLLVLLGALRQGALVAPISHRLPREEAIRRAQNLGANVFYSRSVGVPPSSIELVGGTPTLLEEPGYAINSAFLDGLATAEAKRKITAWLEEKSLGRGTVNFKLRDWLFSRQRYWGEPFPIVWENGKHRAISESELPGVITQLRSHKALSDVKDYLANVANEANDLLTDLPEGAAKEALKNLTFALVNRST